VVGAGVMGGGIAQLIADQTSLHVRMKDVRPEALALGMAHARKLFDWSLKRRRISKAEMQKKLALLAPTLDYTGFDRADLVVEAVIEKLAIKQEVFRELAAHAAPGAVLASNTSSLPIAEIREMTPNPERVVGMHFFNPVHKMPLVEVIVPEGCEPAAANAVFELTRRLGKTPVLVKDSPGFLVNRLLMFYSTEALWLLDEGRRILRLYYSTFDDRLPRQYVDEHEEIIAAIEAGDVERADRLAIAHAGQIVRQIQEYIARDLDRPVAISLS
jgi:3-hydroxyacyl-CoA dehydrogenase/enoyl-CoA hydratase/3-hydroxybutyryl-CoA epimerase